MLWCSKEALASLLRRSWGEERRGEERRGGLPLEGQRSLSFESYFIFFLATHSSGSHKSAGGLRTAFSRAGGGLAQRNQRRITGSGEERRREGGTGGHGNREQNIREKTANRGEGVCEEEEYDGGGVSVWGAPWSAVVLSPCC